jgi:hypothetical protein
MGSTDLRVTTQLSRFQLGVKRDRVRGVFYREARGLSWVRANPKPARPGPPASRLTSASTLAEALPTATDLSLWLSRRPGRPSGIERGENRTERGRVGGHVLFTRREAVEVEFNGTSAGAQESSRKKLLILADGAFRVLCITDRTKETDLGASWSSCS